MLHLDLLIRSCISCCLNLFISVYDCRSNSAGVNCFGVSSILTGRCRREGSRGSGFREEDFGLSWGGFRVFVGVFVGRIPGSRGKDFGPAGLAGVGGLAGARK